jgi:hypothetical protein
MPRLFVLRYGQWCIETAFQQSLPDSGSDDRSHAREELIRADREKRTGKRKLPEREPIPPEHQQETAHRRIHLEVR